MIMVLTKEDLQALGGLIDEKLEPIHSRLDTIDSRLDKVESRLDTVDSRLDTMDSRLDAMDSRLDTMDSRFDAMDSRLDAMDSRLDKVDSRLDTLQSEMERGFEIVHGDIANLYQNYDKQFKLLNENLPDAIVRNENLKQLEGTVENHGERIYALEQKVVNG